MEIRSTEEARSNVEEFADRYTNLLLEKKKLDDDIKALKNEFKEEGVPVGIVCKALNVLKAQKKKTDSQIFEEETIQDWLENNAKIDDKVGQLIAK